MQNAAIAVLLVAAIGVMSWRLFLRGPSRMTRTLFVLAGGILTVTLVGLLVSWLSGPDHSAGTHSTGSGKPVAEILRR
ncbi:hypothetical protein [Fodinicola acaciae]|uniref:hypothetical protein n=1 Tax=Fodinicola acaciae TaxID=2681555 RepID=UPI0013D3CDD1|nr:hypothetical protein [Fodinicola acaciae]